MLTHGIQWFVSHHKVGGYTSEDNYYVRAAILPLSCNTDLSSSPPSSLLRNIGMSFEHVFAVSGNPEVGEKIYFTVKLENRGNVLLVLTDDIEVTFTSGDIDTILEPASGGKQQLSC